MVKAQDQIEYMDRRIEGSKTPPDYLTIRINELEEEIFSLKREVGRIENERNEALNMLHEEREKVGRLNEKLQFQKNHEDALISVMQVGVFHPFYRFSLCVFGFLR